MRTTRTPRRRFLLLLAGASGLVLLGVGVGFVLLLSGAFSTAATKQHFLATHRLLDAGLRYSVRAHLQDIEAPPLDDPALIQTGLACYQAHCTQCHGAPGAAPGKAAQGLLPVPGALAQSAREWPAEWLYYVTRKGVRMTGMPAWEFRLSEEGLWATVAWLKALPFMTVREYRAHAAAAATRLCPPRTDLPEGSGGGEVLLRQYGCHACHVIDGVVGPNTFVGPPLGDWAQRGYIAGVLPNTPENLTRWIREPQAVSPETLMPDLNVADAHARAMAAFLFDGD